MDRMENRGMSLQQPEAAMAPEVKDKAHEQE
jgi:hypothetical protein